MRIHKVQHAIIVLNDNRTVGKLPVLIIILILNTYSRIGEGARIIKKSLHAELCKKYTFFRKKLSYLNGKARWAYFSFGSPDGIRNLEKSQI